MSLPAREVGAARPVRRTGPSRPSRPSAPTEGSRAARRSKHPHPRRAPLVRARRSKHHVGFLVLSSLVIGSMVLGLVSLNALLAQRSFRIDDLRHRIDALSQERLELQHEQASLSAPGRIAGWAHRHGMRLPDDIRSLHVPGTGTTRAPAGAAGSGPASLDGAPEGAT